MIVLDNETEAEKFFIQEGRHHIGFHLLDPYKRSGSSGHNDSMKDPPILTDVKLVGGWLCTAGVSLVTQERLWSTIPFPIRVSSQARGGGMSGLLLRVTGPTGLSLLEELARHVQP